MKPQPLIKHLEELRKRLITSSVILIILFLFVLYFIEPVTLFLENFLLANNAKLIVLTPLEIFYSEIKLAFFLAVLMAVPFLFYEIAAFVKPAFKTEEKKLFFIIFPSALLLFFLGVAFNFFVFLKFALQFLSSMAVKVGVANLWSIGNFISFIFFSCLIFGLLFTFPLLLCLLNKLGIITASLLRKKRKYVYVLIFLVAAIATPSVDGITQIILAVPLIILYEASLLFMRLF